MLDLAVTRIKPLLPLTAADHKRSKKLFFHYFYRPPFLQKDSEERRREELSLFISSVQKVPVFWLREHYDMAGRFLRSWVEIIYSDGQEIRKMQAAFKDVFIIMADVEESFAYIQNTNLGEKLRLVVFNPGLKW